MWEAITTLEFEDGETTCELTIQEFTQQCYRAVVSNPNGLDTKIQFSRVQFSGNDIIFYRDKQDQTFQSGEISTDDPQLRESLRKVVNPPIRTT